MNTKNLLLSLFLLGFIAWGCQKEIIQETPPDQGKILAEVNAEDLAIAMQWYEEHQVEQYSTRSDMHNPLFEVSVPDWETCVAGEDGTCKTVETYLNVLNRGFFFTPDVTQAYEKTGDERYLRMLTRLVILTSKVDNSMIGFYMTVVPSKKYLDVDGFQSLEKNSYTFRDKNLDGYVLFHELNGNFINGWIYGNGKITAEIYSEASDNPIQTRAGTMVCIDHYSQTCTDWYSSSGGETHYSGTTCDLPIYTGKECYSTGGGGGSGGGVGDIGGGGGSVPNLNKGDTIPVKYKPTTGDVFVKSNLPQTMDVQDFNTCVPAIMEYINNNVYGDTINRNDYCLYYLKTFGGDVYWYGVQSKFMKDFVEHFFYTTSDIFTYEEAIKKGYPIMTDIPLEGYGHNVVIIGYQKNDNYIYMNPEDGKLYSVQEGYFQKDYNFFITGIKK